MKSINIKLALIIVYLCWNTIESAAQKGAFSILVGPMFSLPQKKMGYNNLYPAIGAEAIARYNFTEKSTILLQGTITDYKEKTASYRFGGIVPLATLKAGYQYNFASGGWFLNGLAGADIDTEDDFSTISFTLGGGKRFKIKKKYVIDAGVDYVAGDRYTRLNLTAMILLFQRPKI